MTFQNLAPKLFNAPLFAHPAKAEIIARQFAPRLLGVEGVSIENPSPKMGILTEGVRGYYESNARLFDTVGRVAHIPIEGSLINKGAWLGSYSGMTSYEGLSLQIDDAETDAGIAAAVFEVDSFGGEVDGAMECAARIARLSAKKPTIAIMTSHACSAGYMLASAANQMVAPVSGVIGSIGVISLHYDMVDAFQKAGIAVTVLRAGEKKAAANPYEKIPSDTLEEILGDLESLRNHFAELVGKNRGSRFTAKDALETEARSYRAEIALEMGLIDAVSDPAEAFKAFVETYGETATL